MKPSNRIANLSTYYFADKLAEVRTLIKEGRDIINVGIGNPDMATPETVITELQKASMRLNASQYQPYRGIPALRHAFVDWYQKIYGVKLSEDELLPLMGTKEAIMHIHLAFCNTGDTVLIPNPGYPTYAASANLLGLQAVHYDLNEENRWLPSITSLEKLNLSRCKVMWISYPHMPTGAVAQEEDLKEIVQFAQRHNILLVNDNPYSLILNDCPISIHSCKDNYEDVLELNSLSKSYNMPGWRVGVVSGSKENINHLIKVKSNFDSGMYKPIQQAAIRALELGTDWFVGLNKEYQERIEIIYNILDELGCTYDKSSKGMFVWARVGGTYENGEKLSDELLYNLNIFAPPGIVFGSNGDKYIRLSLCVEQDRLKEALSRIKNKNNASNNNRAGADRRIHSA